jgi:hypothetical protein
VSGRRARAFLQQFLNLVLPRVFVDDADVLIGDTAIAIDQQRDGHARHVKALGDIRIADDDLVGDGMVHQVRLDQLPTFVIHRDADASEPASRYF